MKKCINAADATISITYAVKNHWIHSKTKNTFQIFNAVKSVSSLNPINFNKEKHFLFCANLVEKYKGADLAMDGFCKSAMFQNGYKLVYVGNYRDEYKEELLGII